MLANTEVLRASRTPAGPATLQAEHLGDRLEVEAWGPGADVGARAGPGHPRHPRRPDRLRPRRTPSCSTSTARRRACGFRRTGLVIEALIPAVLSQRVTGFEAKRSFRQLVERWGEPAPGPGGLLLPPEPQVIADLGYYELHVVGVEKRRADTLKRVERPREAARALAQRRADRSCGISSSRSQGSAPGPRPRWRASPSATPMRSAWATSTSSTSIAHALAGEPRGTDERMLELLEPFAGPSRPGVRADRVRRHHGAQVRAPAARSSQLRRER